MCRRKRRRAMGRSLPPSQTSRSLWKRWIGRKLGSPRTSRYEFLSRLFVVVSWPVADSFLFPFLLLFFFFSSSSSHVQHTGHIGIGEMRSGQVDVSVIHLIFPFFLWSLNWIPVVLSLQPTKIKEQMMTVAATIKIDLDADDDAPPPPKEEAKKEEEPRREAEASSDAAGESAWAARLEKEKEKKRKRKVSRAILTRSLVLGAHQPSSFFFPCSVLCVLSRGFLFYLLFLFFIFCLGLFLFDVIFPSPPPPFS